MTAAPKIQANSHKSVQGGLDPDINGSSYLPQSCEHRMSTERCPLKSESISFPCSHNQLNAKMGFHQKLHGTFVSVHKGVMPTVSCESTGCATGKRGLNRSGFATATFLRTRMSASACFSKNFR